MEKRQYMMCAFRKGLDEDIKAKYFAIPESKRSDALRDAFRLYMGIDKKLVYETSEKPIKPPTRPAAPMITKGVNSNGNSTNHSRTWRP